MAAADESLDHIRREGLFGDEVAVALECSRDRSRVAQRDPVSDVEPGVLAQVIQMMCDLARESFDLELRRAFGLERHGRSRVAANGMTWCALVRDEHLVRSEREPLHRDGSVAAFVSPLGECLPDPWQILTELWSEHLQVGLYGLFDEAFGLIADLERLHVQLILHDLRELGARVQRSPIAISRASVLSASYKVWYAASESPSERAFQKRARFLRTYQVERSSQNASTLKIAVRT